MTHAQTRAAACAILGEDVQLGGYEAYRQCLGTEVRRLVRETDALVASGTPLKAITWYVREETPGRVEASVLVGDEEIAARYPADFVEDLRVSRGNARTRVCCVFDVGVALGFEKVKLPSLAQERAANASEIPIDRT